MTVDYTATKDAPRLIPSGATPSFAADIGEIVQWFLKGRAFRRFTTIALMNAESDMENNDIAIVDAVDGAYFKYDSAVPIWRMDGVARFADASARSSAIASPVQGMRSALATAAYTEEIYLAAYNVSTNPSGSRIAAGWYPLRGRTPIFKRTFSQLVGSNVESAAQAGFTDVIPMFGITETSGVFTFAQAGLYQLDMSNYNAGATSFGYVHVTKNGTSTVVATSEFAWGPAGGMTMHLHEPVAIAAGDTLQFRLYQNTGSNQTIAGTFSARYLGPA